MLTYQPREHVVCDHSDAAFVASFAAVAGIAHYYGVLIFCCGFFGMLQIVWLNLQRASTVARLRHMPPPSGMHWLVDSAIILFLLVFLMFNFVLGQYDTLVVASEWLGFALLLFQFMYVFRACCIGGEPPVTQLRVAWKTRVLWCVMLVLPFVRQFVT
jgi:hypothetical protein